MWSAEPGLLSPAAEMPLLIDTLFSYFQKYPMRDEITGNIYVVRLTSLSYVQTQCSSAVWCRYSEDTPRCSMPNLLERMPSHDVSMSSC